MVLTEAQQHASFHKGGVKKLSGLFGKVSVTRLPSWETILCGCVDKYTGVEEGREHGSPSKFFKSRRLNMYASDAVFRQGVEHLKKRSIGDKTVRYKACQNSPQ